MPFNWSTLSKHKRRSIAASKSVRRCRKIFIMKNAILNLRKLLLGIAAGLVLGTTSEKAAGAGVLNANDYAHYVDYFNTMEPEEPNYGIVRNPQAWDWMVANIPLFDCPDNWFQQTYYYRWWCLRKHIKYPNAYNYPGFGVTEFIISTDPNSSAFCHHIAEMRWLHNQQYLDQYILFYYRGNNGAPASNFHSYSGWVTDALYRRYLVNMDSTFLTNLVSDCVTDYTKWESDRKRPDGLFWQYDTSDSMEESISGSSTNKNVRPPLNSYMAANARALVKIATLANRADIATTYQAKYDTLRTNMIAAMWDSTNKFFKVQYETGGLCTSREAIGFIPWVFNLPGPEHAEAWAQLADTNGFWAPMGLTTAERRSPYFRTHGTGSCEWDGAVWPFATSQTLDGLANMLRGAGPYYATKQNYFDAMLIYAQSHQFPQVVPGQPYLGEYLDEKTGFWLKGTDSPRSLYYNHSTFADLVIAGMVGLIPREDNVVEVNPLIPTNSWDWFCLDNVLYHKHLLTIVWDRDGQHYGRGAGLNVYCDDQLIASTNELARVTGVLLSAPIDQAPPAPTGLLATAGSGQVSLSWNASAGATNYIVKRSTSSNSGYVSIATNSTTTYTNTPLLGELTYYYVVSAVNAAGYADSLRASATPTSGNGPTPFFYDSFSEYSVGTQLPSGAFSGGVGFGNNYGAKPGVPNGNPVVVDGLSYPGLQTAGNAVYLGATNANQFLLQHNFNASGGTKTLAALAATNSGTLWLSFLFYNPSYANNAGGFYREASFNFMIGANTTDPKGGSVLGGVGMPNTSASITPTWSQFTSRTENGSTTSTIQSGLSIFSPDVQLVVIRMDVNPAANTADKVYLWINPAIGGSAPGIATALLTNTTMNLDAVNGYRLVANGINGLNTNAMFTVDQVRFGATFASVTPAPVVLNSAPGVSSISSRIINVGFNLLITNTATDSDTPAQSLTFSLPTGPTNATIGSASGILNWRPQVTQANSTNPFSVVVTDNGSPSMSTTQSFNVVVNPLAQPSITAPVLGAGQIGLTVNGQVGPDYAVQASSNLTSWSTLFITNPTAMPFNWSTNTGSLSQQYYRIKVGPPLP